MPRVEGLMLLDLSLKIILVLLRLWSVLQMIVAMSNRLAHVCTEENNVAVFLILSSNYLKELRFKFL